VLAHGTTDEMAKAKSILRDDRRGTSHRPSRVKADRAHRLLDIAAKTLARGEEENNMHPARPTTHRSRSPQPVPAEAGPPVSADWDPWHEPLSDASVLPAQFFSPQTSLYTGRPVATLLRAVLEDALTCFQKQFVTEGRGVQRMAREAEEWFLSDDAHWPFSFVSVCAVLGLEPESVRQQLKRWSHSHLNTPQRKMQHIRGGRQSPRFAA
jgi:hypothetical protein